MNMSSNNNIAASRTLAINLQKVMEADSTVTCIFSDTTTSDFFQSDVILNDPACVSIVASLREKMTDNCFQLFEKYVTLIHYMVPKTPLSEILLNEALGCVAKKKTFSPKLLVDNFVYAWSKNLFNLEVSRLSDTLLLAYHILSPEEFEMLDNSMSLFMGPSNVFTEQLWGTFSSAGEKMGTAADSITQLIEKLQKQMEQFGTMISDMHKTFCDKFAESCPGFVGAAFETLSIVDTMITHLKGNILYIVYKFISMITAECTVERIIDLLSALGIGRYVTEKVITKLAPTPKRSSFKEQMDLDSTHKFLNGLLNLDRLSDIWKLDKGLTSLASLYEKLIKVLKKIGFVKDEISGPLAELQKDIILIEEAYYEYADMKITRPRVLLNPQHLKVLKSHQRNLRNVLSTLEMMKERDLKTRAVLLLNKLDKLIEAVTQSHRIANVRPEPVAVVLLGAGGIGKSRLSTVLKKLIAGRVEARRKLSSEDPKYLRSHDFLADIKDWAVWNQNTSDSFDTGYEGQEVHAIDDGFQDAEEKDHLQYFNLISSCCFPLNQASLADKGKPYLARLMTITANKFPTKSKTIRDMRALARRFQLVKCEFDGTADDLNTWRMNSSKNGAFDSSFSHLKFSMMSALEYVASAPAHDTSRNWKSATLDQVCDFMIDSMVAKQLAFEAQTEFSEQADDDDRHTISLNSFSSYQTPSAKYFFDQDGDNITSIKPIDGTFYKNVIKSRFGGYPLAELKHSDPSSYTSAISRVNEDHPKHIGKLFTSELPVRFVYREDRGDTYGGTYHVDFPIMGESLDPAKITVKYIPSKADEEEDTQTEEDIPEKDKPFSFWAKLYDTISKVVSSLFEVDTYKYIASQIFWVLRRAFFPSDEELWRDGFWKRLSYDLLAGFIVGINVFLIVTFTLGRRFLGDMPTCMECWCSPERIQEYLVQRMIMRQYHSHVCGWLKCDAACTYVKWHRYPSSLCQNEVSSLFSTNKCCNGEFGDLSQIHIMISKLYKIDPELVNFYTLADQLGNNFSFCSTDRQSLLKILERCFFQCFGLQSVYQKTEDGDYQFFLNQHHEFTEESGDSKKLAKRKYRFESGDSKKIARRRMRFEANGPRLVKDVNSQAVLSYPMAIDVDKETLDAIDKAPPLSEEKTEIFAEEYGLRVNFKRREKPTLVEEEASTDPGALDAASSICNKSVFVKKPHTDGVILRGLPISSNRFLVPAHLTRVYPLGKTFKIETIGGEGTARIVAAKPEWDLALAEITTGNSLSSLRKFIPSSDQLIDRFRGNSAAFFAKADKITQKGNSQRKDRSHLIQRVSVMFQKERQVTLATEEGYEQRTYEEVVIIGTKSTLVETVAGDCGSPYILLCPRLGQKLVGMHILGSPTEAVGAVLTSERIVQLEELAKTFTEEMDLNDKPTGLTDVDIEFEDCNSALVYAQQNFTEAQARVHARQIIHDHPQRDVILEDPTVMGDPAWFQAAEEVKEDLNFEPRYPLVANGPISQEIKDSIVPISEETRISDQPIGVECKLMGTRAAGLVSSKSMIQKHFAHGVFPVKTKPAFLKKPEGLDLSVDVGSYTYDQTLYTKNTSKWCKPLPKSEVIDRHLRDMEEQLTDYFLQELKDEDMSPITSSQAISGIGAIGLDPMNRKSSAGIPYTGKKAVASKAAYFNETGKVDPNGGAPLFELDPMVLEAIDNRIDALKRKERTFSMWKDCLKDETRPVAKVDQGKTRIFTCAPVDFTVLTRMLLGKFKVAWQKNRSSLFHAVGVDPHSSDWGAMYFAMKEVGTHGFDCDFSSFDGNLRADFMRAAIRVIARTVARGTTDFPEYAPTEEALYEMIVVLLDECVETMQQSGNTVWMSRHGNPSGNPLTTELNCIVNLLYHWYCFRRICELTEEYWQWGDDTINPYPAYDLSEFMKEFCFFAFGDDAVYSVKNPIKFSFARISHFMGELGQEYTNAAKTSELSAELPIEKLSFLKRTFTPESVSSSIILAPIEQQSLTEQFNWCSYAPDALEIHEDLYENTLLEFSLHGREAFNDFVERIHPHVSDKVRELGGRPMARPSYKTYKGKAMKKYTK